MGDQALRDKQALVDNHAAETEKTFEQGYKKSIINATMEMATLKGIIYQVGFEFGLEKAQIPIGHELNKLKIISQMMTFGFTTETTVGVQMASAGENAERTEG